MWKNWCKGNYHRWAQAHSYLPKSHRRGVQAHSSSVSSHRINPHGHTAWQITYGLRVSWSPRVSTWQEHQMSSLFAMEVPLIFPPGLIRFNPAFIAFIIAHTLTSALPCSRWFPVEISIIMTWIYCFYVASLRFPATSISKLIRLINIYIYINIS